MNAPLLSLTVPSKVAPVFEICARNVVGRNTSITTASADPNVRAYLGADGAKSLERIGPLEFLITVVFLWPLGSQSKTLNVQR